MAEYTLAMILLANKQAFGISRLYARRDAGINREREFPTAGNYSKTVGLLGASRIGRNVARCSSRSSFDVLIHDPYLSPTTPAPWARSRSPWRS